MSVPDSARSPFSAGRSHWESREGEMVVRFVDVGSVAPTPELHNSECPRFCPDLSRVEPLRVKKLGMLGA